MDGHTGVFFDEQEVSSLTKAVDSFETQVWDPLKCRRNAERFSAENFKQEFETFVEEQWARFRPTEPVNERAASHKPVDWVMPHAVTA